MIRGLVIASSLFWSLGVFGKDILISQKSHRKLMGTTFEIILVAPQSLQASQAMEEALDQIERVDIMMSEWKPDSMLSNVNQNAGVKPVKVSDELFEVLKTSWDIAQETDGTFDPTWASLWGLWKFKGQTKIPSKDEVDQRLAFVDWKNLILNEKDQTVYLAKKGMMLGLGAIAKGYALQKAGDELKKRGFTNFLLNAGGQVLAHGKNLKDSWKIGVQHPRMPRGQMLGALSIKNESVSTSGDNEQFFIENGVRYHHILDLKTGFPAKGVQSATIVHRDAMLADAYSTVCFIVGYEKCILLAKKHNFDVLLVDDNGKINMTSKMKKKIKLF